MFMNLVFESFNYKLVMYQTMSYSVYLTVIVAFMLLAVVIVFILYTGSLKKKIERLNRQSVATMSEANSIRMEAIKLREEAQRLKEELNQKILNARKESVQKSRDVVAGKVSEQLAPYFPAFKYNPREARFIGTPIDIIVFNGIDNGNLKNIVFIEVKTGSSKMTEREKLVKEAIDSGRVSFELMTIDNTLEIS